MSKLDKDLYLKHAKRLKAIINEQSSFAPFLARKDFAFILERELNLLHFLEKKFPGANSEKELTSDFLLSEYNRLTKKQIKFDETFTKDDDDEIIDIINYLSIYCNNIFKVNLDDLVKGKKVKASTPGINFKDSNSSSIDMEAAAEAYAAGNMAGMGGMGMGMGMPGNIYENPYFMGKAYAKLQQDAAAGKFYKYSTKPKIIVTMKWAAVILLFLSVISLILMAVFAFMANGMPVRPKSGSQETGYYNTIFSGVFYILFAGIGIYALFTNITTLKTKNENNKYYLTWPILLVYLLCVLLIVLPDMRFTWLWPDNSLTILETQGTRYIGLLGWKYLFIVTCVSVGLLLAPIIIGGIYNPKPDQKAIEAKLKEYIDNWSSQTPFGPSQPAADVQKPVEVKDADDKKSSSKPKDEYKS